MAAMGVSASKFKRINPCFKEAQSSERARAWISAEYGASIGLLQETPKLSPEMDRESKSTRSGGIEWGTGIWNSGLDLVPVSDPISVRGSAVVGELAA